MKELKHIKSFNENKEMDIKSERMISKLEDMMYVSSALLKILIQEGILLIKNGVNPDKVYNWVMTINSSYENPPKPLSKKEVLKREYRKKRKSDRQSEKNLLLDKLQEVVDEFDIKVFAFFDWKSIEYENLKSQSEMINKLGYNTRIDGNGAYEVIISANKISDKDFKTISNLINEINDFMYFYEIEMEDCDFIMDSVSKFQKAINNLL